MDMAEILNQWDSYQAKEKNKQKQSGHNTVSHKKANAPTPEEKAAKAEKDFEAKLRLILWKNGSAFMERLIRISWLKNLMNETDTRTATIL